MSDEKRGGHIGDKNFFSTYFILPMEFSQFVGFQNQFILMCLIDPVGCHRNTGRQNQHGN